MSDFGRRALLIATLVVAAVAIMRPAEAQQRDEEARSEYVAGKAAYEKKEYESALQHFTRSYTLSGAPLLLYNIASTQQALNHPGAAAETLAEFLKARPEDPERANIESRIAALGKAQQIIDREDAEKRRVAEQKAREREAAQPSDRNPGWLSTAESEHRLELTKERERKRRRNLALGLGIGLGLVAAGAIAVGVVCGTGHCSSGGTHDFDFGPFTVTK